MKGLLPVLLTLFFLAHAPGQLFAQSAVVKGSVLARETGVPGVTVLLSPGGRGTTTDSSGDFSFTQLQGGNYTLRYSMIGYSKGSQKITLTAGDTLSLSINLEEDKEQMEEVVVTGTLKEVRRIESPVPVEVYSPVFFKKNPTPNIFEALQNVNGVRPQLNCNVCNTGDIHINGLEGPYTMVLIDGMPIVSSLSTVYGLSGIPNSLVERIEIVKGPASS